MWQKNTASGRKICVSGLLQFPCCVVFHCLGFAVFGAIGFPVDDSAFEYFHCVTEPDKKEKEKAPRKNQGKVDRE